MAKLNNVLVIDDDDEYNFLTEDTFMDTELECNLVFKEMAQEALDYLEENSFPDLILLDINMPVMNGWEFLEEYQERNYHTKHDTLIVMISSSCYHEDRVKAKSYPKVVEYIEKPISCDDIHELHEKYFGATTEG
ncbi:response regulator [Fulvivirga sp. RKSG066]|uniref:response regulator n=1 Tax=Fulvivirga aurantia TaxID=2529383 RepID=UPI0012BC4F41|nr:response regulator [Fulvivirga aurantia]MTI23260.1 response regulator [Fulvivirga aurantia]